MKVLLMTGSHPRHAYVAKMLADAGYLSALVVEERLPHIPQAPANLSSDLKMLFELHFKRREEAEDRHFGRTALPNVNTLEVKREELNTEKVHDFIRQHSPDILFSYGVHMLSEQTLACTSGEKWNIHGGLSPWYRGCTTHFWPSYFLEPQMTGMTVHDLTQQLDAGDVVHQNNSALVEGDGLHDLACRAVLGMANELPMLVEAKKMNRVVTKRAHKSSGKVWMANDWRPEHLKLIYEHYDDRIVDMCLEGQISGRVADLHRQFD